MDLAIMIGGVVMVALLVLIVLVNQLFYGRSKACPDKILLGFQINENDGQPTCGTSDKVYSQWVDERSPEINFKGKEVVVFTHRILATAAECEQIFYVSHKTFVAANLPVPSNLRMDFLRQTDDSPAINIILGSPEDQEAYDVNLAGFLRDVELLRRSHYQLPI
ncbi:MAG: hypothetical protein ABII72_00330 [Parcubacteria group bacterium]